MVNLLFDLDGTLVDSHEGILSSLKLAFSSLGRETPTDSLESLKAMGARMFVATSKPVSFASEIVRQHGLARFFQTVYGSELDGKRADKAELIDNLMVTKLNSSRG